MVDHSALRVNQAGIIITILLAFAASPFLWSAVLLIPALAVVMLLGTWRPRLAAFKQLYFHVLAPRGIVQPRLARDAVTPHNFAQGLGGAFLVVSSLLLVVTPAIGLAVALLVAALAFVNLAFGYCLGCQVYFLLGRSGVLRQA
ncbi:MAG: DUF4395 domain-containing protein [Candidatus Dormibacteraeota bacterium]|nr:DUF4395 domain-containing protein [Candidatus Dormibacteraeota bacterium]